MKRAARTMVSSLFLIAASCGEELDEAGIESVTEPTETVMAALSAGTMVPGEYLFQGQRLNAAGCHYNLRMQTDGNLVAYSGQGASPTAIWATHTEGSAWSSAAYTIFQNDGNLVVYSGSGRALWASHSEGEGGTRLRMQDDGNVVIYAGNTAVWASHSERSTRTASCGGVPATEVTQVLSNADRPGSDLAGMPIRGLFYHSQCGKACVQNASCKAYTWVPNAAGGTQCWLKGSVPAATFGSGMISGVRTRL